MPSSRQFHVTKMTVKAELYNLVQFSGFYRNIQLRTPMAGIDGQSRLICELPRGAAQLVRAAAFLVDVYDRRDEDAAAKRQRKKEQALVAQRLQGLRTLTLAIVVGN